MITKNGRFKCDSCGSFIGKKDSGAIVFTPYGSTTDLDPPESEHECGKCVSKWSEWQKNYAESQTWITPSPLFPPEKPESSFLPLDMSLELDSFIEDRTGFRMCEREEVPQKCEKCGTPTMQLYYQKTDYWSAEGNFWCLQCAHDLAVHVENTAGLA